MFGQHLPGGNQQPTSEGHNRLVRMLGFSQALVLRLPIGITAYRAPQRPNLLGRPPALSPAQFLAPLFGDGVPPLGIAFAWCFWPLWCTPAPRPA